MPRSLPPRLAEPTNCPLCNAELKGTTMERVVKPLGHRKHDPPVVGGQRDEYCCGAVKLTSKQYPTGTIEATCCRAQ